MATGWIAAPLRRLDFFFFLFFFPFFFPLLGAFAIVKCAEGLTMGGFRLLWEAAFHLNLEVVV